MRNEMAIKPCNRRPRKRVKNRRIINREYYARNRARLSEDRKARNVRIIENGTEEQARMYGVLKDWLEYRGIEWKDPRIMTKPAKVIRVEDDVWGKPVNYNDQNSVKKS